MAPEDFQERIIESLLQPDAFAGPVDLGGRAFYPQTQVSDCSCRETRVGSAAGQTLVKTANGDLRNVER